MNEQDWGGPYLSAAFFCEKILQESDGVVSAIRIVDRINAQAVGLDVPDEMPKIPVNLTLFVSFRSGEARGSHDFTLVFVPPSGVSTQRQTNSVLFEGGEDRGVNVMIPLNMLVDQPGVYWFDILLGDRLVTRIPLRIVYQRQTQSSTGTPR